MLKFQYVPHEVISAEGFEKTAAENIFVTPDGEVAILDGNHAVLIIPDADNTTVVISRDDKPKDAIIRKNTLKNALFKTIAGLDLSKNDDSETFGELMQVYRDLF